MDRPVSNPMNASFVLACTRGLTLEQATAAAKMHNETGCGAWHAASMVIGAPRCGCSACSPVQRLI